MSSRRQRRVVPQSPPLGTAYGVPALQRALYIGHALALDKDFLCELVNLPSVLAADQVGEFRWSMLKGVELGGLFGSRGRRIASTWQLAVARPSDAALSGPPLGFSLRPGTPRPGMLNLPAPRRSGPIFFPCSGSALQPPRAPQDRGAAGAHLENVMIEIREVRGRYEVYSVDRHWEVFEAKLAAQATALALAGEIQQELGRLPTIIAPWPVYPTVRSAGGTMPPCPSLPASTGAQMTT